MELYRARATDINDEERCELVFSEIQNLEEEVRKKSIKTSNKSKLFWWINTLLNLTIIFSSATIVIIMAINNFQNVAAIVLGGLIFAISGVNELLKLGSKGYYYKQGTFRLRRIRQQARDIIYMFQNFTNEQVLAFISSLRTEIDEIDMDLYNSSMIGEARFGNGLRIISNAPSTPIFKPPSTPNLDPNPPTPPHIHIHIDSPNNSPNSSPNSSPRNSRILDSIRKPSISNFSNPSNLNSNNIVEIEETIVNL